MQYQPKGDEAKRRRQRVEERSKAETDLRARVRDCWPEDLVHGDGLDTEYVDGKTLRRILQEHDRPHSEARIESWRVTGMLGRYSRFAFTATFSLTAANSSANPPDESSDINNLADVQWSITDTAGGERKFYRFSSLDDRAPVLLTALLAKGDLGGGEPHLMQATVEQLKEDRLVRPDHVMEGPATARFSDLDLRLGRCSLKRIIPSTVVEGVDVLATVTYHLHLEGRTNDDPEGSTEREARAVLDLTLAPRVVPMLEGDHGIMGHGDWRSDVFCYSVPHIRVTSGSLRIHRASDELELARELDIRDGAVWMEHRFGGVVPRCTEEGDLLRGLRRVPATALADVVVHRCTLRLFNDFQDALAITRLAPVRVGGEGSSAAAEEREREHVYVSAQSAKTRSAYGFISTPQERETDPTRADEISFHADQTQRHRSPETGLLYPTSYTVRAPLRPGVVANLTVTMMFPEQEMVSSTMQPASWFGLVSVKGSLTRCAEDGTEVRESVTGAGFLELAGHGALQRGDELFEALRAAATAPLEAARHAAVGQGERGWERVADGPALAALKTLSIVASMHQLRLTDAHKVVLNSMLGVYGYIYHHPDDRDAVEEALTWCHTKWIRYFGSDPIDYTTLTVRAFMFRELGRIMQAKCGAWIAKEATALDIIESSYAASNYVVEVAEVMRDIAPPSPAELAKSPGELELAQLKALMDGTWVWESTVGSLSAVLIEQQVPVLWRNLMAKVRPTLALLVDRDSSTITCEMTTIIEEVEREIQLSGQEWVWRCPARGDVRSRACARDDGRQLCIENYVHQGVERVWYTFDSQGKKMKETTAYYRTVTVTQPSAWCVRTFKVGNP